MKIQWSAASVRHLREVVDYLEGESSGGAMTTRLRIMKIVKQLSLMPYSGRVGRVEGTREAVVNRSPYIVVYQVTEHAIEISRIFHGAQDWP